MAVEWDMFFSVSDCYLQISGREKLADGLCNLFCVRLQGEVSRIEEAYPGIGHVALERFRTRRQEEWIVLAPHRQEVGAMFAEIRLEGGIKRYVALIVEEQIELDLVRTFACKVMIVERDAVGRHEGYMRHTVRVLPAGGF